MVTARYELLFYLLAFLVGGLLLRNVFLAERPPALALDGFTQAQHLPVLPESSRTSFGVQDSSGLAPGSFMEDDFIWFATAALGDEIAFALNDVEAGLYALELYLAPSGDFGVFRATLNDQVLAASVDLHHSAFRYKEALTFSPVSLQQDNILRFTVVGHNPATSAPHYQFGIDGIRLRALAP